MRHSQNESNKNALHRTTSARPHYGWVVVAAGTLTVFCCLGLGRFALGMLLPSMGQGLDLTYREMGLIGTGNFVGYLAAVLLVGPLAGRLGARVVIASGLALVGGSMLLIGRAGGFGEVLILYVLTGIGSGAANVPVMGLVSAWFARGSRGRAAGFVVIGSGFAIMLAGTLVPAVNAQAGLDGWRWGWWSLGAVVLAVGAVSAALLRDRPEQMGLAPYGGPTPLPATPPALAPPPSGGRLLLHLGLLYMAFGFTYSIYATFIVTALVQDRGFPESSAGTLWAWIGFLSLFSGPLFGMLSDRLGRRAGMVAVFSLHTLAYGLAAAPLPPAFLQLSVALFGLSAWSIPSIMAAAAGDYLGPDRAATAFGRITFLFGIGQIAGPAIAGELAKATGGFGSSFALAALVTAAAAAGSKLLRSPADPSP